MNSSERRLEIYNILLEEESIDVNELAQRFSVSPMTIRRDLAIYEKQGILTTTYGGAYLNQDAIQLDALPPMQSRLDVATRKMGEAVCCQLTQGESIFLDSGLPALGVAHSLNSLKVTVVTNSLDAANILRTFSRIKLIMAPGTYDQELNGFIGSATIAFIRQFSFNVAILGGKYIDTAYGMTVEDETDAHLKATAVECAKRNIVVAGSTNLGESAFAQAVPLRKISQIVTDSSISEEHLKAFEQRGIQVTLVG
jgi:DeoR/GlpR family transcriptional regulator of sugar metabolism